ncbi:polyketide cyclase [alpha proteobacterium U9-1i]|nr:polyketide cyclase [alpha proteobacterium U9-1i]
MASIVLEEVIAAAPERAWSALADFANAHRAFAGVLTDCRLESDDVRVATFANGQQVRERLIGIDHDRRRIAYSALSFAHHNATFEVAAAGSGSRVIWSCDLLPNEAATQVRALMEAGLAAVKRNLA